jgi:hypothetical protein
MSIPKLQLYTPSRYLYQLLRIHNVSGSDAGSGQGDHSYAKLQLT